MSEVRLTFYFLHVLKKRGWINEAKDVGTAAARTEGKRLSAATEVKGLRFLATLTECSQVFLRDYHKS